MPQAAAPILNHAPNAYIAGPRQAELAGDKTRIADKILYPILNSEDITVIFPEKWTDFKEWRDEVAAVTSVNDPVALDALLRQENELEAELRRIFSESSGKLGEERVNALLGSLQFRGVVRETALLHADKWPSDSLSLITRRMLLNELCLVCILYHLETGDCREINAQTLAHWSYKYADYASLEVGYACSALGLGRKLERPE